MEILKMFYTLGVQIACLGMNCKVYLSLSKYFLLKQKGPSHLQYCPGFAMKKGRGHHRGFLFSGFAFSTYFSIATVNS